MKLLFRLRNLFCRPCLTDQADSPSVRMVAKKDRELSIESHALNNAVAKMQVQSSEIKKRADALSRLANMR